MLTRHFIFTLAFSLFVVVVAVVPSPQGEQVVLPASGLRLDYAPHGQQGVLRRYNVLDEKDTKKLLERVQDDGWDVWQVTPSHLDVFSSETSPSYDQLDNSFHSIVDTPITYTKPTSHTPFSGLWDLSSLANTTFYVDYRPLNEIYTFMEQLAAQYPERISIVPLGHSGEGREMYALEISASPSAQSRSDDQKFGGRERDESDAPLGFVITGAQHAREWVVTSTAVYLAQALVANATEQFALSPLLGNFNFYIVPVPNPDGYVYTWEHDRFWYKNRQNLGHGATCTGVDMNRNWGYKWAANPAYAKEPNLVDKKKKRRGNTADPCSHWYPGSRPFQAPEVNNMANYFETLPRVRAYMDLRSYGQMLSSPYSYSCKKSPKDAEDQMEAISGAASAVRHAHGTIFTTGPLCSTLYRAPGNVVDWMYARLGVKWSFAAHLRDTGTYGFNLPAQWIRPVAEETTRMVEYLARFIATKEVP